MGQCGYRPCHPRAVEPGFRASFFSSMIYNQSLKHQKSVLFTLTDRAVGGTTERHRRASDKLWTSGGDN